MTPRRSVVLTALALLLASALALLGGAGDVSAQSTTDYDTNDNNLIDITTLAQLNAIRHDLNGNGDATHADYAAAFPNRDSTSPGYMGCQSTCAGYELLNDLDFDTDDSGGVDSSDDYPNWTPIGTSAAPFSSTLQGNGHTIANLTIDAGASVARVGLFGQVSGAITGIGLPDASVSGAATNPAIGALVGYLPAAGTVTSSWATGSVSSTSASIFDEYVGGLVGYGAGTVRASYATASVTAASTAQRVSAGGLVGQLQSGTITASYATGAVAGGTGANSFTGGLAGIMGGSTPTVTASYSTGAVSSGASANIGGLSGSVSSSAVITASYWDTTTSGHTGTGAGTGQTTTALQTPTAYGTTGIYRTWNVNVDGVGVNDDPWHFGTAAQYPILQYQRDAVGIDRQRGSASVDYADGNNLIDVTTLAQLDAIRYDLDGDGSVAKGSVSARYAAAFPGLSAGMGCPAPDGCAGYELKANLDFDTDDSGTVDSSDDYPNWTPIGTYSARYAGTFQGNHHTIANLTINSGASVVGMFTAASGAISGVGLRDVNVTVTRSPVLAGTLTGDLSSGGTITASWATGSLTATNADGNAKSLGGMVGSMSGSLRASYTGVSVTGPAAASQMRMGGLVGLLENNGTITASYATGPVSGGTGGSAAYVGGLVGVGGSTAQTTITASYATGRVTSNATNIGGLAGGLTGSARAINSYWDTETSGIADSDPSTSPGEGKTTAELQTPAAYGTTGIYSAWNVDLDNADTDDDVATGGDDPWDFGYASQYPALKYDGLDLLKQQGRGSIVIAPDALDIRPGASDTYTVRLGGPPKAAVEVNIASDSADVTIDDGDGTFAAGETLNFSTTNWLTAQTVTVKAASGATLGDTASLAHTAAGAGSGFASMATTTLTVAIIIDYDENDNNLIDVTTLAQLDAIRHDLNGNGDSTHTSYIAAFPGRTTGMGCPDGCTGYELRADLDFDTNDDGTVDSSDAYPNWTPLGNYSATFQGNHHVIANLRINNSGHQRVGLFGELSGHISGVGLPNVDVVSTKGSGPAEIGGLVGYMHGGASITSSWTTGRVAATGGVNVRKYAGGLVGRSHGTVQASYSRASVSAGNGFYTYGGGVVGYNYYGTVRASYATGRVYAFSYAGGVVGLTIGGAIRSSYAVGVISGGSGGRGGLLGGHFSGPTVANSYYNWQITGGGLGTSRNTNQLRSPTTYAATTTDTYFNWNLNVDGNTETGDADGNDDPWHFGYDVQYPVLQYDGMDVLRQDRDTILFTPAALDLDEGDNATYTARLGGEPKAGSTVTVTITVPDDADVTIDGPDGGSGFSKSETLGTFNAGNWMTPQTVSVRTAHDADLANDVSILTHAAVGAGSGFEDASDGLTITIEDDDLGNILLTQSGAAITTLGITEAAGNVAYQVAPDQAPVSDATVTITSNNAAVTIDGPDSDTTFTNSETLTFTTGVTTAQTVTIKAADDNDPNDESVTLTHTAAGEGSGYDGVSKTLAVTVTDDDTPNILLSAAALTVTEEDSGGGSYTVRLTTEPTADVTVTVTATGNLTIDGPDAATDFTASETLTFTASDWNTATTTIKVIAAADDDLANNTIAIAHSAVSADSDYHGVSKSLPVTVTDNDTPTIIISETGTLSVNEGGTGTYTVKLSHRPDAGVTVTVTSSLTDDVTIDGPDAGATFSDSETLSFATSDWNTPQTVTVQGATDNDLADSTGNTLSHAASNTVSSMDSLFTGAATVSLSVTVTDTTTPGILLTQSGAAITAPLGITEQGSDVTYDVALSHLPKADVTVTITTSDNTAVTIDGPDSDTTFTNSETLTFTTGDWSTAQTVTLRAPDDGGGNTVNESVTLTHEASGAGSGYASVSDATLTVNVTDDDTPNILLSAATLTVTEEDSGGGSYTVRLATAPTADVAVTVTASGSLTIDGPDAATAFTTSETLTFTMSDYAAKTINVRAAADNDLANNPITIAHTAASTDSDYAGKTASLSVTATDNDTPSIVLSQTGVLSVNEGGAGAYTVKLSHRPDAGVTVTVTSSLTDDVTIDGPDAGATFSDSETLSFATTNWNTPQTVTVKGATDNDLADSTGNTLSHAASNTVSSMDSLFTGAATVSLSVTVDDTTTPSIVLTQSGADITTPLGITEDAAAVYYDVALSHAPLANVTVTVTVGSTPTNSVEIYKSGGTFSGSQTLTFTPTNYNTTQGLAIRAPNDPNPDDETGITLSHAATDATSTASGYDGISKDLTVNVTDDDTPNILLSAAALTVTEEDSGGGSYTVRLTTEPTADVTVTVTASGSLTIDGPDAATDFTASETLTFTASNWNTATTTIKVIAAADDDLVNNTIAIAHSAVSADSDYAGKSESLPVTVMDNDTPSIVLSQTGVLSVNEGGTGAYTVKLSHRPDAGVTITITSSATDDVEIDGSDSGLNYSNEETLRFSTGNWNSPQTVRVRGLTDNDLSNDLNNTLTHAASNTVSSQDSLFSSAVDAELSVTVTDTTSPSIVLTQSGAAISGALPIDEEGSNVTYQVGLSNRPLAPVTVTITSNNAAVTIDGPDAGAGFTLSETLRFNTGVTTAQTVTIQAPDDGNPVNESVTLTHAASGSLSGYASISDATLTVNVTDNDTPNILLYHPTNNTVISTLAVTEEGAASYRVRLATLPTAGVTVTITASGAVTISGDGGTTYGSSRTLSFTTSDWNTPQTITVRAADDNDLANGSATLAHAAANAGATASDYAGISKSLPVTVMDNDTPSIVLSQTGVLSVNEGGSDSYTVKLSHRPAAGVTVTVTSSLTDDVTIATDGTFSDSETLSFATTNWNTPQTVTVQGATDNDLADSTGNTLSHAASNTVSSMDSLFTGAATVSLSVTVTDTTTPGILLTQSGAAITAPLGITEQGSDVTYDVALSHLPKADVTVTITTSDNTAVTIDGPDSDTTFTNSETLTFTTGDWSTAQTVTLRAPDDGGGNTVNESVTLTHEASGAGSGYASISDATLTVNVTDDDTPNILLSATSLTVTEADSSGGSYTVRLATAPTANVTVTVTASGSLTIDGPDTATDFTASETLTFTMSDYAAKTINVRAGADNDLADNTITIAHTAASTDSDYAGISKSLPVTVTDNDTGSLILSHTARTVTEGDDAGATYTVKLSHRPSAAVTVAITSANGKAAATPSSLTFNAANWNTTQTVMVTAVADADLADGSDTLTHTPSATGGYLASATKDVTVTVQETTAPGMTFSESRLSIEERDTDTYTVALAAAPPADATVAITSSNPAITVNPGTLTFPVADYNTPLTVTVTTTADDDAFHDASWLTHTPTVRGVAGGVTLLPVLLREPAPSESEEPARIRIRPPPPSPAATSTIYAIAPHTLTVSGTAGVPDGVTVNTVQSLAGDLTITFSVPSGIPTTLDGYILDGATLVGISVTPAAPAGGLEICLPRGDGSTQLLHYRAGGWTVVPGSGPRGDQVCGTVSGFSPFIAGQPAGDEPAPVAPETEPERPPIIYNLNIRFDARRIALPEGHKATYQVRLAGRPAGRGATIRIRSDNPDVKPTPAELRFTAANWEQWQTVSIAIAGDANHTDESATLAHYGPNRGYGSVLVSVTDTGDSRQAGDTLAPALTVITEPGARWGVTVTPTAPADLTAHGVVRVSPAYGVPRTATGYGLGRSGAAQAIVSIAAPEDAPASGLTVCLPVARALAEEAGERRLTLLRYVDADTGGGWQAVPGAEYDAAAQSVCAAGVTEFGAFAAAYILPQ